MKAKIYPALYWSCRLTVVVKWCRRHFRDLRNLSTNWESLNSIISLQGSRKYFYKCHSIPEYYWWQFHPLWPLSSWLLPDHAPSHNVQIISIWFLIKCRWDHCSQKAATVWRYHVNMDQHLWGIFPAPWWINVTKNQGSSKVKRVQPGTSSCI